jgi:HK97 family phage prohead protease
MSEAILRTKAQYVDVTETEGARVYTFRASTGAVDRQNEIVEQSGWDLDSYRMNPVVLDSHKYDSIEDVIGRAIRVEVVNGVLEADIIFADTEKGECAEELVNTGFLSTVSVGFRSLARRPGGAGQPLTHTQAELLEISLVAVPANSEAYRIRSLEEPDESEESGDESPEIVGNNGGAVEQKAGRVISAKNLNKLQMAMEAISEVIASVGSKEAEEGYDPKKPRKAADEESTVLDLLVPPELEAALKRFVGGGNHG